MCFPAVAVDHTGLVLQKGYDVVDELKLFSMSGSAGGL